MNEIAKLIVTLVGIFSLIGSIGFYLNMMNYSLRMSQGDYNATQEMAKDVAEEITSTLVWKVIIGFAITLFSALGLTTFVKYLKNL